MKKIQLLLILCGLSMCVQAQRIHVNLFGGTSNYVGDLFFGTGKGKLYNLSNAKFAYGVGVEYELTNKFSLRSTLTFGRLGADDKKTIIDPARNLNFATNIQDLMLGFQYHILDPERYLLSPYLFTGIAFFHFNPYTFDSTGTKVFLQPLSTEGQGFVEGRQPYKLYQVAIPYGAGVKVNVGDNFHLMVEICLRKTFTDYIDDVSTTYVDREALLRNRGQQAVDLAYRGDELKGGAAYPAAGTERGIPRFNDRYYFSTISASFRLGAIESKVGRSRYKCPTRI
jgi:hypothetical protein